MVARTWSEIWMALEPGAWKIGIATACLLLSSERRPYCEASISTRATSPSRVTTPPSRLMTIWPNCSGSLQAALDIDGQLQLALAAIGRAVDDAGRDLDILAAHGVDHVVGGHAALGDLLRVEPEAHGVIAAAEQLHIAHALDLGQLVLDVQHRVIAQIQHVIAAVGRVADARPWSGRASF